MDLKVMLRLQKGHRFILCMIDEVTNYFVTVPTNQFRSEEIGQALIEKVIPNTACQTTQLWTLTVHLCLH